MNRKKKKKNWFLAVMFLFGFCLLMYPMMGNYWNQYRSRQLRNTYEENISKMASEDYSAIFEEARIYNEAQTGNLLPDAFAQAGETPDDVYMRMLNVGEDGIMAYLEIPKIDIRIPIYHGTSEAVLSHGAGHMQGSSLPIGGESTHAVMAGHRGLPSEKLFTDLNLLQEGDTFYIYVLDQILAYEVDQMLVVEPYETDALSIIRGEDHVTMVTCTPYGVNTHRLLVRGHRIEYSQEVYEVAGKEETVSVVTNYGLVAGIGMAIVGFFAFIFFLLGRWRRKR